MTPTETIHHPPVNEAVPFQFEELFFSRTDERGIILSGNTVFQHISQFDWDELLHKPHNIIRHPDMPKAVFYLLWDTIKKGNPIGAYVKNKAKDGRYYWVFAIVTPIEGGYLSVRLKPSSPFLGIVEQEYKSVLAKEKNGVRPAESAVMLLDRLKELGFNDYGEFMATAISKEMAARDTQLGKEQDKTIICFDELMVEARTLLQQASIIYAAYEKNEYVPLNLRVQSAQLGDSGATISVISSNYTMISTEIRQSMSKFIASAQDVFKMIHIGLFLLCTTKIQHEVVSLFQEEEASEHFSQEQEMSYLESQQKIYRKKAIDGLQAIIRQANSFRQSSNDMKMLALGLGVTRLMGKVESSRLTVIKDSLNELIDDLEGFQMSVLNGLKDIDQRNREIQITTQSLLKEVERLG